MTALAAMSMIFSCEEPEQDQAYTLMVNPMSISFEATGNSPIKISVTAEGYEWTAVPDAACKDWITVEYEDDGITVSAADNETLEPRTGSIEIIPEITSIPPVSITVQQAKGVPEAELLSPEGSITYYAQNFIYNTNGTDEWLLQMCTMDSEYEIAWTDFGANGYWSFNIIEGTAISLYLYCEPAEDFYAPEIQDGTYTACYETGTMTPMTFMISHDDLGLMFPQGSSISEYTAEGVEYTYITDGSVTLTHNGDEYEVYMLLTLEDGNEVAYEFSGTMPLSILGRPPYYSDLTEDLTIENEDFVQGTITHKIPEINYTEFVGWQIEFLAENVEVNGTVSNCSVNAKLYAPFSEDDRIPDGEYEINVTNELMIEEGYTALAGGYDPLMGNSGCHIDIFEGDNINFAPMSSGTVTVTWLGNSEYRFVFDAMDDNGHSITATYEGEVIRADSQL